MSDALQGTLQDSSGTTYTLEIDLVGGGLARVFVAEQMAFGRRVVIKPLARELAAGVNVVRLKREIQLAAPLQYAHIVPVMAVADVIAASVQASGNAFTVSDRKVVMIPLQRS